MDDLAAQLGTSVEVSSVIHLEEPSGDTYDEMMNDFKSWTNPYFDFHQDGYISFILYDREMDSSGSGGSRDSYPNIGYASESYVQFRPCYVMVNANIRYEFASYVPYSQPVVDRFYRNMVKHEILHTMLPNHLAPDGEDDHSYGKVTSSWFGVTRSATPMLSAYSEVDIPIAEQNETPSPVCESSSSANYWSETLSSCTEEAAKHWLDVVYPNVGV